MKEITHQQVEQCRRLDRIAQKRVFEILYPPLFRIVQRYLVNTSQSEDCVMRGILKVFQQIDSFIYKNKHSLFVWAKRIVINEALMELRKRTNFFLLSEAEVPDYPDTKDILNKMESEEIFQLILKLPDGYRTVLNLFIIEGYSHKEISEILGISESTSKTQYRKAKARLKQMLLQQDNTYYGTLGK